MGIGAITVAAPGSPTAPTTLAASASAALTAVFRGYGFPDTIHFPSINAIAVCDGMGFQYHFLDAAQYLTGPLAPWTAPTLASTATQATAVLTFTGASSAAANAANNDLIQVGAAGTIFNGAITFKSTLDPTLSADQVKIGANADATISNLTKFINNTGTQGTEYWSWRQAQGLVPASTTGWAADNGIEVSASTAFSAGSATITFRAIQPGTAGNVYNSIKTTGATLSFGGTTFSGGTAGTGTAPSAGSRKWAYSFLRTADGAETAVSPETTLSTLTNANVTVSGYDTPKTRDGMDLYRIFRTTEDGAQLYQVADDTASPTNDDQTDDDIRDDFREVYDETIVRPHTAGYPTRYRYHTQHLGAVVGIGAVKAGVKSTGTASVTLDSRTVTMSALICTDALIGRTFKLASTDTAYTITDASESGGTITLERPYEGATNATASYLISDDRDPSLIGWCEPLLLNNWPGDYNIEGIVAEDDVGGTGITSYQGSLLAWTRARMWRILGDFSGGMRLSPFVSATGAYCNRAVVEADGKVFWLGPDGCHAWAGGGDPVDLSKPDAQEGQEIRGIDGTLARINPDAVDGIVGNYNPTYKRIRWFVPVDGSQFNNFVIVLDLQTLAFTFASCDAVTSAKTVLDSKGNSVTVVGDAYGRLWQLDAGYSDGAYGFECVQSVSSYSASARTVTVAGTPFPTSSGGLTGVPVYHIDASGNVARRTIVSNTSSVLTLDYAFDTAPVANEQIVVGGIPFRIKTTKFSMEAPEIRKTISSVAVQFIPSTAGQLWCAGSIETADPSVHVNLSGAADYADLTATKGMKVYEMRKGPGRTIQLELFAIAPGFDVTVVGFVPTIRAREDVAR